MKNDMTRVLRARILNSLLLLAVFIIVTACGNAVENASNTPRPVPEKAAPKVLATLSDALEEAGQKTPSLRAKLVLNNNDEYDMNIVNGVAVWQQADCLCKLPTI